MYILQYKLVSEEDVPQIIDILNKNLSFGLASKASVLPFVDSPTALCVLENEKVVGIITSSELTDVNSEFLHHQDVVAEVNKVELTHPLVIKHLAVDEAYRHRGIGNNLLVRLLDNVMDRSILTIGWITPMGWNAQSIFQKNGFHILMKKDLFWKNDSLKKGYGCPHCRRGCLCSAYICYRKQRIEN